jgi:hypothetical protein
MDIVRVLRTNSDDSPNAYTEILPFQKVKQAHVRCAVVEYSYSAKFAEVIHHISGRRRRAFLSQKMELDFIIRPVHRRVLWSGKWGKRSNHIYLYLVVV